MMTWPELLVELDRWVEALTADHEITPAELDAAVSDLAGLRAYELMSTAVRRGRSERC